MILSSLQQQKSSAAFASSYRSGWKEALLDLDGCPVVTFWGWGNPRNHLSWVGLVCWFGPLVPWHLPLASKEGFQSQSKSPTKSYLLD